LFARHAGSAWLRQIWFQKYLGDGPWELSIDTGEADFGDDMKFEIQLLGSEAQGTDHSWQWAWANEGIEPAPKSMHDVEKLKAFGQQNQISEFTQPTLPLEHADAHALAMVAATICDESCYFRGPYDGGAVYFLIKTLPEERSSSAPMSDVLQACTELVQQFRVNNRTMMTHLLQGQGFEMESTSDTINATRHGDVIRLEFNQQGRLATLNGRPATQSPKRWWQFWRGV